MSTASASSGTIVRRPGQRAAISSSAAMQRSSRSMAINVPGAGGEQGAGEPAGAGADLDHGDAGKVAGGARDAGR